MFSRIATSSARVAAQGIRHATTVSAQGGKNEFKALRDATKAHAAGEFRDSLQDGEGRESDWWGGRMVVYDVVEIGKGGSDEQREEQ
jgi:hypothetical protein